MSKMNNLNLEEKMTFDDSDYMTPEEQQLRDLKNLMTVKMAVHKLSHQALEEMRAKADKEAREIKQLKEEIRELDKQIEAEGAGHPSEVMGGGI